ncbi:MAG: DUF401 family protein [Clostridia bacterium]|nr:DUF401 family protein [Clostridia bacterium]
MLVVGLILTFTLILWLVKKAVPIGLAIICGGMVLALFAGFDPLKIIKIILITFTQKGTIYLILTVILINILSTMMKDYGIMDLMVEYLEKTFKSIKALLFIIPSLLATFTATGSAIIAAPIIDSLGDRVGITPARKAAINLYVRHAWYFILPIAVNLVNASFIGNIPIRTLVKAQFPVSVICLATSYLVFIRPIKESSVPKKENKDNEKQEEKVVLKALFYTSPIILSIMLVLWMPTYIALFLACILTFFIRKKNSSFSKIIFNKKYIPLVLAAAGVMIFKNIIENIPQLKLLLEQILSLGISLEIIVILMTSIASYVAANLTVVIGLMYPLILPLVAPEQVVPIAALIYTIGYATYFISPIHLCQALTNEYFGVSMKDLYKEYKIAVPVMYVAGLANYLFLRGM